MNIFSKKEKLIENIAFFSIMSSINVIFVIIAFFLPVALLGVVLLLTFASAFVGLLCKKRYFPIYLIVTVAICCLINLSDTIFFIIPSIISGFLFAVFIERKMPTALLLLLISIIQMGLTYASYLILEAIYNVSVVDTFFFIFKLTEFEYKNFLVAPAIFLISLGQVILSYIVLSNELPRFGFEILEIDSFMADSIVIISSTILMLISIFVYPDICYLLLIISLWFGIDILINLLKAKTILSIVSTIGLVILTPFIVAIFNSFIPQPFHLLSLNINALLIIIIGIINYYLLNRKSDYNN